MRYAWLCVALLVGMSLPLAFSQGLLQCFPTVEFAAYTSEPQDVRVAFTLKAPEKVQSSAPLSLTTVLDRSGSMHGRKMELLKATSKFLVNKLAQDGVHNTGVFVYANEVVKLIPLLPVNTSIAPRMNQVINSIFAYGQTFLSGGLRAGIQQQKNGPEGFVKNVFLFTDGLPTVGATTTEDILMEVKQALSSGDSRGDGTSNFGDGDSNRGDGNATKSRIKISTFAVGDEIDAQLLRAIARVGGGESYIIQDEEDIPIAFGDALGGLLSIVSEDIDVVFKPINGAFIRTVRTGGNVTEFADGIRVSYSDLFAEERRDLVLKIAIPESVTEIMEIQVAYTDAFTQKRVVKERMVVTLDRSATPAVFQEQESTPVVGITDTRLATAEAVAEAQASAKSGNATATATALATATAIVNVSPVKDDPTIIAIQKDLEEIKRLLAAQAVAEAQAAAASGNATATATAVATAEAIVNVDPVEDDPTIRKLQRDIEEIKALLAAGAIQEGNAPAPEDPSGAPAPASAPPPESDGVVERQLGTLADVLTSQRSSVGSSGDPELAVNEQADTEAKRESRRNARKAVLEPEQEAPAPSSRSRKEGPEDLEEEVVEPPPMVLQTLTEGAEVVDVPMPPPSEQSPGSGLPPDVAAGFEPASAPAAAGQGEEAKGPAAPVVPSLAPSPESPAAAPSTAPASATTPALSPSPAGDAVTDLDEVPVSGDNQGSEDPVPVQAPAPGGAPPVAATPGQIDLEPAAAGPTVDATTLPGPNATDSTIEEPVAPNAAAPAPSTVESNDLEPTASEPTAAEPSANETAASGPAAAPAPSAEVEEPQQAMDEGN